MAIMLVLATGVVVADLVTSAFAERDLANGPVHVVGFVELRLAYNTGAAFNIGRGYAPVFAVIAVAVSAALIWWSRTVATRLGAAALGMVLGGAVGNLLERVFGGHGGAVVDFVDLRYWPVFNLADAAIVTGAILFVLLALRRPGQRKLPVDSEAASGSATSRP